MEQSYLSSQLPHRCCSPRLSFSASGLIISLETQKYNEAPPSHLYWLFPLLISALISVSWILVHNSLRFVFMTHAISKQIAACILFVILVILVTLVPYFHTDIEMAKRQKQVYS